MVDYDLIKSQMEALSEDTPDFIPVMANVSALLFSEMPDVNWAGFYLVRNSGLTVGPFQGKPACIHIPMGRGVCGTAAMMDEIQVVPDVHLFPGHIACDSESASEIVIPIHHDGKVAAVLDMDSPVKSRFSAEDTEGLTALVRLMEQKISW